ncbi:hypothetical protein RJT17_35420 [Streptomyces sp. P5-A9]|uniref:hypothetical protein n=1 Tax=Streptomyces sp. P5-A9 TaxID=3071730 RepID=UPI002FC648D5
MIAPGFTLAGAAVYLPARVDTAAAAISRGVITMPDSRGEGFESLPVSEGLAGAELGVRASELALTQAGVGPLEVDALVYAWVFRQGASVWSPAHRVARLLGAHRCVALGVQQMSNGGAAALEIALARLLTEPSCRTVVVATGDEFRGLPYDRWRGSIPVGDGGTAVVVTSGTGRHTVSSIVSAGAPGLELDFFRSDPFDAEGGVAASPFGRFAAVDGFRQCVGEAVEQALKEAELTADDPSISTVLLPRAGTSRNRHLITAALPPALRPKVVRTGATTGHLGAGDLLANLAEYGAPAPGRHHLLVSIAAGLTVTAAITTGHA